MPRLTPELITHLCVVAILLSVFYFLLKPKKQGFQRHEHDAEVNTSCTNDYHAVKLRLDDCDTIGMCSKVDQEIEVFYDIYYQCTDKELIDNYYVDLITQLTDIKIRLRSTGSEFLKPNY
jgi:hypothetical protein